jgi:V/A-type H+/Na+-transporting ATPase subunit E
MTLEDLVEEIRRRGEADLAKIGTDRETAAQQLQGERDRKIGEIRDSAERETAAEVARQRTQRVAAAKLRARKMVYEAREARLTGAIDATRTLLEEFTGSGEYPVVLKRMVDEATRTLGSKLRVSGRPEDASLLQKVAGRSFDPKSQRILGGLVAETPDGSRRLNLSFDELLRLHEDKVRELLT